MAEPTKIHANGGGLYVTFEVEVNWRQLGFELAQQSSETQATFLNELLTGFDGFGSSNKGAQIQYIGDDVRRDERIDDTRLADFLARLAKAIDPEVSW